jgi:hypothetical protein
MYRYSHGSMINSIKLLQSQKKKMHFKSRDKISCDHKDHDKTQNDSTDSAGNGQTIKIDRTETYPEVNQEQEPYRQRLQQRENNNEYCSCHLPFCAYCGSKNVLLLRST